MPPTATVVTCDPRGADRSPRTDAGQAPGAGPDAGGARAARRPGAARPRAGAGRVRGHP